MSDPQNFDIEFESPTNRPNARPSGGAVPSVPGGPSLPGGPGPQGPQGPVGPQGAKGDTGPVGPVGPIGPKGTTGNTGQAGSPGARGDTGPTGSIGPVGATGLTGSAGAKGDKGDTGAAGTTGLKGDQGIQGDKGDKGDKGDQGIQGIQGIKGDTGTPGDTGPVGPVGPAGTGEGGGTPGPQGEKGDKGDPGDTGPQGPQGIQGNTGPAGPAGTGGGGGGASYTGQVTPVDLGLICWNMPPVSIESDNIMFLSAGNTYYALVIPAVDLPAGTVIRARWASPQSYSSGATGHVSLFRYNGISEFNRIGMSGEAGGTISQAGFRNTDITTTSDIFAGRPMYVGFTILTGGAYISNKMLPTPVTPITSARRFVWSASAATATVPGYFNYNQVQAYTLVPYVSLETYP